MATPFLLERCPIPDGRVHLLPTADVVLVVGRAGPRSSVRWVLPHRDVVVLDDGVECATLTPNVVKCLLGEPRLLLGAVLTSHEHPMLAPFEGIGSIGQAEGLLHDLRDSLEVTADENDFLIMWHRRREGTPLLAGDRRVQRLCLRFAGQPPATINSVDRLARTLDADNAHGSYNGLGAFADASHLGRVCRAYTGRTPRTWRNMSQTFY